METEALLLEHEYVTSADRLPYIAREISQAPWVALDLETTGFDPFTCKIRLLSVNTGKGVYVIDAFKCGTLGPVLEALDNPNQLVGSGHPVILGQNVCKFDQKFFLHHHKLELWPLFDTFRASALLHNGKRGMGHNLYDLYQRELGIQPLAPDLGASDWSALELTQDQKNYAAEDVIHLPSLYAKLKPQLAANGLNWIALIEFGAGLPEASVELNGFYLNSEAWTALANQNVARRDELNAALLAILPDPSEQMGLFGKAFSDFNLDSNEQLLKSLQKFGMKIKDTSAITLAMQVDKFPVADMILDYREAATAKKSFGLEYIKYIKELTGRIHSDYYGFLAAGRYSCSHPNLAQIPRDKKYRGCFQAQEGRKLVIADYGNIEMRIIAEVSKDPTLVDIFVTGKDAHQVTASIVTGKPESEIGKKSPERQSAKAVNFGFCIAEGQRVLTNVGLIPIEQVYGWHKVWDGVDWVSHEGLVEMGTREVIEYDGLTATPDHEVYTDDGGLIQIREAASSIYPRRLAVGAIGEVPVRYTAPDGKSREAGEKSEIRRGVLQRLPAVEMDFDGQYPSGINDRLCLSEEPEVWWGSPSKFAGRTLRLYGSAMLSGYARCVSQLQRAWNQSSIRDEGAFCAVGLGDVSGFGFQGDGLRQDGQRRGLLSVQPETGYKTREPSEPKKAKIKVYDLLNAGPRHRFTVEGKIVSNCYGMQPAKLVLYAKAQYGVNMSLQEAEVFRKRYFEKYLGVAAWHKKALEGIDRLPRIARSIGGRLRHMEEDHYNEWLNTPIQSTGADGLKAALRETYFATKKFGTDVKMVHHVHDEIILDVKDDPELIEDAKKTLSESMKKGMSQFLKIVPVDVEATSGKTWAEK